MAADKATFARACAELSQAAHKNAADEYLLGLRRSPEAIGLAQDLLASDEALQVKFQAAVLLRHAAVEQWAGMTAEQRRALRTGVLQTAIGRCAQLNHAVWNQLLYSAATLWKRGWLDQDDPALVADKAQLFQSMADLLRVDAASSPSLQHVVALRFLLALVGEFSEQASAIGLSFDFHRQCHRNFEQGGLRESFQLAAGLLAQLTDQSAMLKAAGELGDEVVRSCLAVLEQCLAWDFGRSSASGSGHMFLRAAKPAGRTDRICPGPEWRETLFGSNFLNILFRLYMDVRATSAGSSGSGSEQVAHLVRQLLIQLSSLSGPVFPAPQQELEFLGHMVHASLFGVLGSPLVPVQAAAGLAQTFEATSADSQEALCAAGASEYLDMCSLLANLVANFDAEKWAALPNFEAVVEALLGLSKALLDGAATCATRRAASSDGQEHDGDLDVDNSWPMEAFGHKLDMWVSLAHWAAPSASVESDSQTAASESEARARNAIRSAASQLFAFYLDKRLAIARASMDQEEHETFYPDDVFEDASQLEDHVEAVAFLGRANVEQGVSALLQLFQNGSGRLQQASAAQLSQQAVSEAGRASEELYWLVMITASFLADPFEGEQPTIPAAILQLSERYCVSRGEAAAVGANDDPIVKLSSCVSQLVRFQADCVSASGGADDRISPLLCGSALKALARWAYSYLTPEAGYHWGGLSHIAKELPASILASYGPNDNCAKLVDMQVRCVIVFLSKWGGEADVCEQALSLLRAIVSNPGTSRMLRNLSSWEELVQAQIAATRSPAWAPLNELGPDIHGSLVEIILKSLYVQRDALREHIDAAQQRFATVVQPLAERLGMVAAQFFQEAEALQSKSAKVARVLEDPRWGNDFARLRCIFSGIIRTADDGPLAQWSRRFVIENMATKWVEMAAAAVVYVTKLGLTSPVSVAARGIISDILRLVGQYVHDQLTMTPVAELNPVWRSCDRIVQVFKEVHSFISANRSSGKMDEQEWAVDVLELLRMLTNMPERDALDFSEDTGGEPGQDQVSVVAVVLQGTQLVFPLIDQDLLRYEGVAEQLYKLLVTLIQCYPEQVTQFQGNSFLPLVNALEFGIKDHRVVVARAAFEAIAALADFHESHTRQGGAGLAGNLRPWGPSKPSVLLHLLQQVFNFVVFQTFDSSLLNPAANAMLALIVCEQEAFGPMVDQILLSQSDAAQRERLSRAFRALVQDNGFQPAYNLQGRRAFQKNLLAFASDVRGFLRTN